MTINQTLVAMALAGLVSFGTIDTVAAHPSDRLQVATKRTVPAGSPQLRAVRRWLALRAAPHAPGVGLDVAAWRSAVVTSSGKSVALDDATGSDDDPFALLPADGSPGARVQVDAVTSHGRESWSYAWSADAASGAWMLERYAFDAATDDYAVRDAG